MSALLDAALWHASQGRYVFPLSVEEKQPITSNGFLDATLDADQIERWWKEHPDANIGVACRKSGLLVIDVDPDHGGDATFAQLEIELGALPRIVHQRTGSGGSHFVMRDPSPGSQGWTRNHDAGGSCRGKLGKGVDVKNNGYILVEPSRSAKGSYTWLASDWANVPEVPAAWQAALQKPQADSFGEGIEAWNTSAGALSAEDLIALWNMLSTLKRKEGKDATFTAIKTIFHDYGQSLSDGAIYLREWNEACGAPHSDAELDRQLEKIAAKDLAGRRGHALAERIAAAQATKDRIFGKTKERELSPIDELNQQYAWIESLGRVAALAFNPISYQDRGNFQTTYNNQMVRQGTEEKPKFVPLGTAWLKSPERRTYGEVGFWAPPMVAPEGSLNLWKGFAVEPRAGGWPLVRAFIREIICNRDLALDDYFVKWFAWMIQNPGARAGAGIAMRGRKGTGKSFLGEIFLKLLGNHSAHFTDPERLLGKFNAQLEGAVFVFADEALWPGNIAQENKLKGLVTSEKHVIEHKGLNAYETRNCIHLMLATDGDWVVPVDNDERRWVVTDVSDARRKDFTYFAALQAELDAGGYEAMLHDLLHMPLGGWHPRMIVDSEAIQKQKMHSLKGPEQWVHTMLSEGELPGFSGFNKTRFFVTSEALLEHAKKSTRALRDVKGILTLTPILTAIGCVRTRMNGTTGPRGWDFPDLKTARSSWEKIYGPKKWDFSGDWNRDEVATTPGSRLLDGSGGESPRDSA